MCFVVLSLFVGGWCLRQIGHVSIGSDDFMHHFSLLGSNFVLVSSGSHNRRGPHRSGKKQFSKDNGEKQPVSAFSWTTKISYKPRQRPIDAVCTWSMKATRSSSLSPKYRMILLRVIGFLPMNNFGYVNPHFRIITIASVLYVTKPLIHRTCKYHLSVEFSSCSRSALVWAVPTTATSLANAQV